MKHTRFMNRLFSATSEKDEELTNQVSEDIEKAKKDGSFEDDEMKYDHLGDGRVIATDRANGEMTLIHPMDGENSTYDLERVSGEDLESYLHPEIVDGAVSIEDKNTGDYNKPGDPEGLDNCCSCGDPNCPGCESKEFSVSTNNTALLKFFSDQVSSEMATEIVTNTDQPVTVGDLSFNKEGEDVIVTDMSSGDKAKVSLDGPELEVTELDQKNFKSFSNKMEVIRRKVYSNAEQYDPIFVVGIDIDNNVLVNAPVMTEEAANELAARLTDIGVSNVQVFANPDEARDYGINLIETNGGVQVETQEEEHNFSDVEVPIYTNRYYSEYITPFMSKMFSEAEEDITATQDMIEDAVEKGEQIETEDEIITPVDSDTAVVEDKETGDFTKVDLADDSMHLECIDEETADQLTDHLEVEDEEGEKNFSKLGSVLGKAKGAWGKATKAVANKGGKMEVNSILGTNPKRLTNKAKKAVGGVMRKHSKAIVGTGLATGAAAATGAGVGVVKGVKKLRQKNNSDTAELIEDKAQEALQNIQEMTEAATQAVSQAKESPVNPQTDIKETQFSDTQDAAQKIFSDSNADTLDSWL